MKHKLILSIGCLSLIMLTSCGKKQTRATDGELPEYPTITVSLQEATLQSTYPVTIKGQEDVEIRPRIDGFIQNVYVDEGSVVRKGQQLFDIDSPSATQALTSALASLSSAEAQLNTCKVDVDRIRPLADEGIISPVQIQTYENRYQSALATLKQAQAQVDNARATIGWTKVTSPFDGIVGPMNYRKGSLVNSANILTTIANVEHVYAYFSLNEKVLMDLLGNLVGNTQAEKIKTIPAVTLTLADGATYSQPGRIETITGTVNVTTGSANLRAKFPNPTGELRSGSSGTLSIPTPYSDVFVIPQKATFKQQSKTLVYKVQGDSVVQQIVSVKPLPDGHNYLVTSGLEVGTKIISDGLATLTNGKKIKAN